MLDRYGLLCSYDLLPTTTVTDVIRRVGDDMNNSGLHYIFVNHRTPNILDHEALPLLVLEFRNRGRVLPSDNEIKLRRAPADPNITLQMMFANRTLYTPPAVGNCVEDGRFVIHLSASVPFYLFILNSDFYLSCA
jgi:hypothetical protein